MDLKEFIKETVSSIADATAELQEDLEESGTIVNPPLGGDGRGMYDPNDVGTAFRTIINIEFDVAVTVADETSAEGRAGLKVFSILDVGGGCVERICNRTGKSSCIQGSYVPAAQQS